ncbi:MAG: sigma-70 family RNA polymerase sigma factor [Phycisphaerales bacterium]
MSSTPAHRDSGDSGDAGDLRDSSDPSDPALTRTILLDGSSTAGEKIDRLLPMVYEQLRGTAQRLLAGERIDHTLGATAVVHEAYMRLVGDRKLPWANRAHFYAAAAEAMRRVLMDHARARNRVKRGGAVSTVRFGDAGHPDAPSASQFASQLADLQHAFDAADANSEMILALDDGIRRLEDVDPRAATVLRLRFFAGLTVSETASAMDVSPRQVDRLWAFARAWLFRDLEAQDNADPATGDGDPGPGD